jgi:hypothetical protein
MAVADDFMLLALKHDDGKPLIGHLQLECGLAAAVLVELAQAGRIDVEGDVVVVRDAAPSGLPQEDAALARIVAEDAHDLQWWVGSLRRGLAESVMTRLVAGGDVAEERVRRFGVFTQVRHPLTDHAAGRLVHERLSTVIDGGPPDPDSLALLAIAHATGLDRVVFPGADPAVIERRIDEADAIGDAVTKVVRHVLAAMVTVLAAVTAAM